MLSTSNTVVIVAVVVIVQVASWSSRSSMAVTDVVTFNICGFVQTS